MLRLRPYKPCDAKQIVSFQTDEVSFRKWCANRFEHYPITAEDMNAQYDSLADTDTFFPMTAFDETGVVGHLILRFLDAEKTSLRIGFVIIDPKKRGLGYGKEMLSLTVKFAFEIMKITRLSLVVFENNEPAVRCYQAAGFTDVPDVPGKEPYIFSYCSEDHTHTEQWKGIEMEILAKKDPTSLKLFIDPEGIWYHGSNKIFTELLEGSTITQWKELAEAFSHKPHSLSYDGNGVITHNGTEKGYLYVIDEPITVPTDVYQHPFTTMDKNAEFLTRRPLKVRLIKSL